MKKEADLSKKKKFLLIVILVTTPLIFVEIISAIVYQNSFNYDERKFLRVFMGLEADYLPNMVSYYKPHPYLVYTLNGDSVQYRKNFFGDRQGYYVNQLGFRGKECSPIKPEGTYRIVCMGSSTTFCMKEIDETKTYPQMLEDTLNRLYQSPRFEVINAGTPGWTTAESLINFHFRVLELDPDMIIVYHAVNDTFPMRRDNEGESDYSNWRKILHYEAPSFLTKTFLRYSAFYRFMYINTHELSTDITALTIKRKPVLTDEDENLEKATGKYFRRNMEGIVNSAKANKIVPVLMTMGHGPWHKALTSNNQITREIARKKGALLVDFERVSKPSYFTSDNVHLTRTGNKARVNALVDVLSKQDFGFVVRPNKGAGLHF